MKERRTGW